MLADVERELATVESIAQFCIYKNWGSGGMSLNAVVRVRDSCPRDLACCSDRDRRDLAAMMGCSQPIQRIFVCVVNANRVNSRA